MMTTKVCERCGIPFNGYHNARYCGDDCRVEIKRISDRKSGKDYRARKRGPISEPEPIPPFPDSLDRDLFGAWLSGFTDGEATFVLRVGVDRRRAKESISATFRIVLRQDDENVLRLIQSYWRCGSLTLHENDRSKTANAKPIACYGVQKVADLTGIVIPHFDRYPLRSKKGRDFAAWRRGVSMLDSIQRRPILGRYGDKRGGLMPRWTDEDKQQFRALKAELEATRVYA